MQVLTITAVSKNFKQHQVLKNVNLTVNEGEFVSITGQNGSGKTVLMDCIAGLIEPDAGTIRFWNDQPISHQIREKIGIVNTTTRLFEYLTPLENIQAYSEIYNQKNNQQLIQQLFRTFEMDEYLTDTKTTMDKLSTGQNVKVHLIKALMIEPKLLLLDEPTAYLDKKSKQHIMSILKKYKKQGSFSCIIISHSQSLLKICDRVLTMRNGRLSTYA